MIRYKNDFSIVLPFTPSYLHTTMASAESHKQSPIAQVIGMLRAEKYATTKEEEQVLAHCAERIKKNGIQGFLAAGSIVWSVTGGLNLMQRLTTTVAGAAAAGYWVAKRSVSPCIEDILALDGSHLQERLAFVLQKEQVHNLHMRSLLEKRYYLEPLYTDGNQDAPGVLMRKREHAAGMPEKLMEELGHSEEGTYSLQKEDRAPQQEVPGTATSVSNAQIPGPTKSGRHDENTEFPFGTLVWDSSDEEPSKLSAKDVTAQKHKKKMGVIERREYNRLRYLEWEEKRNKNITEAA